MNTPRKRASRVAIEGLPAQMVRLVAEEPHTALELRELTGYSIDAIRTRLYRLETDKRIHRVLVPLTFGVEYLWHAGPAPEGAPVAVPARRSRPPVLKGQLPRQTTVRTYPNVGRRDPLVAALFGAPARTGMLAGILSGEG